jgi:hypothetical protein
LCLLHVAKARRGEKKWHEINCYLSQSQSPTSHADKANKGATEKNGRARRKSKSKLKSVYHQPQRLWFGFVAVSLLLSASGRGEKGKFANVDGRRQSWNGKQLCSCVGTVREESQSLWRYSSGCCDYERGKRDELLCR